MTRVAVLGGGQLGRMLALAGIPLGCSFSFLDPSPEAPAGAVGDLVVGNLNDAEAARRTAKDADVVTFEWEGVPAATVRAVNPIVPVYPNATILEISQDRVAEKQALRANGIETAPYRAVNTFDDLRAATHELGLPAIVKTRRGGYDGKGQIVLHEPADLAMAWEMLGEAEGGLILEGFVEFDRELSIVAVRGRDGTIACYPAVENVHKKGILRVTRAPARGLDDALQLRAEACIRPLLTQQEYVGVCCVELFDVGGELIANEIAPRVHNSGHWTIEGAETSQFENHVRAVLGMPLGSTASRFPTAMMNCIGRLPDRDAVMFIEGTHWHDYGKSSRPGRKVGHVTVTAPTDAELNDRLRQLLKLNADG